MTRLAKLVARMILACGFVLAPPAMAQQNDELSELVTKLREIGRTAEAIPLAERLVVVVRKKFGPDHAENATALGLLSNLYEVGGRLDEAERVMREAVVITRRAYDPFHPRLAEGLAALALLLDQRNRRDEAEILSDEVIRINERAVGQNDDRLVSALEFGGLLANLRGNYAKGKLLFARGVRILEHSEDPKNLTLGRLLKGEGNATQALGDYDSAEALLRRAIAIFESDATFSEDLASALQELAKVTFQNADYQASKLLLIRAISVIENSKGATHIDLAPPLTLLAQVYQALDQYKLGEPLILRAVDLLARAPEHYQVLYAEALHRLAAYYTRSARHEEARQTLLKALAITEPIIGGENPDIAWHLQALARADSHLGHFDEAMEFSLRALTIRRNTQSLDHPDYVQALEELGSLHYEMGRYGDAQNYIGQAIAAATSRRNKKSVRLASANLMMGMLEVRSGRPSSALTYFKAAFEEEAPFSFFSVENDRTGIQQSAGSLFVATASRMARLDPTVSNQLGNETFVASQYASNSGAASSLAKMAVRSSLADGRIRKMVRRAQDLALAQAGAEFSLMSRLGRSLPKTGAELSGRNLHDDTESSGELDSLARKISADYPEYAALVNPVPLTVDEARSYIHSDEALVLFSDAADETFIWVITKTDMRWVKSDLGTKALQERVAALRCGLDNTNWTDASGWPEATEDAKKIKAAQVARRERCKTLTGADVSDQDPPPFDVAKARELYKALFGGIEDLLRNPEGTAKELLVVPSGALTQLPFQVLVTGLQRQWGQTRRV